MAKKTKTDVDGGAIAIRGFLFQFDKTIIEAISNRSKTVSFECRQDIDFDDYVIQVKHHAALDFSPSRIKSPVLQLLRTFQADRNAKTILYCHFRDKAPGDWMLTKKELASIIGSSVATSLPDDVQVGFIANFKIRFSVDFEAQFQTVISDIEKAFSISRDEAILYHSVFQSNLLNKSTGDKALRQTSYSDLKSILDNAEVRVFHAAYQKYLSAESYLKQIKKVYFTFHTANVEKFERLFVIDGSSSTTTDLIEMCGRIAKKYFKKDKSPQPYVCILGLSQDEMTRTKRDLFDHDVKFFDGTYFHGDSFRKDNLFAKSIADDSFSLKIVMEADLGSLLSAVKVKEIFHFYTSIPLATVATTPGIRNVRVQFQEIKQVIGMF